MGEIKIIVVSRRWPKELLKKVQRGLRLAPVEAGSKLFRSGFWDKKAEHKKD